MVSRAAQRRGGPSPHSVVSVADLLARDAPWAGAPSAVAVAKRPTGTAGSARDSSARDSSARCGTAGRAGSAIPSRTPSRPADGGRLRQFASAAWGPQWRFVTIAGAVLLAGLMANGVMLAAFSGPSQSATAESDEGGYPSEDDPNQASRTYDDNGIPVDSALMPMFALPASTSTQPGVGLPMTLTSLGTTVPAVSPTRTTVLRGAPSVSTPVRAVSPSTDRAGTGTGSVSASNKSGSSVGNVVRDTASGLGKAVDDTASGLGKTVKKTATGLGDTVGNVADDLLGTGGSSKSKSNSSSSGKSSDSSRSSSGSGLLGGLVGR